jgi:hypothetical protein
MRGVICCACTGPAVPASASSRTVSSATRGSSAPTWGRVAALAEPVKGVGTPLRLTGAQFDKCHR